MSYLGISETAKVFNMSERHIRRMISEGRWPFYRFGSRMIRIDPEEVKALGRRVAEGRSEKESRK